MRLSPPHRVRGIRKGEASAVRGERATIGKGKGKAPTIRRGAAQGPLEGITACLKLRFGAEGAQLLPAIQSLDDVDRLQAILKAIETGTDLEELRRLCA